MVLFMFIFITNNSVCILEDTRNKLSTFDLNVRNYSLIQQKQYMFICTRLIDCRPKPLQNLKKKNTLIRSLRKS